MHRINLVPGLLLSLCLAAPLAAQTADTPAPVPAAAVSPAATLPDTAAGRALGKFLRAIADPDVALAEDDFSPMFVKKIKMEQIGKIVRDLRAAHGQLDVLSVEADGDDLVTAIVVGQKSRQEFRVPASVDKDGRIKGLFFQPAPGRDNPPIESFDRLNARLAEACESPAFGLYRLKPGDALELEPIHRLNADRPLAVGSTFKLYVLAALAEQIAAGTLAWDRPVPIQESLKSLPSGVMQNEPDGKAFPVREMAEKMISISDNTATDHLLHLVGREAVERQLRALNAAPERTLPFLSTREMFQVKLSGDLDRARRYAEADEPGRRAMIAPGGEIAKAEPNLVLAAAWLKPVLIDRVEWFISADDACRVMAHLYRESRRPGLEPLRDILSKNPGLPVDRKVWSWVGYKGGSEPGVLNMTWVLEAGDGAKPEVYLLSATFNDTRRAVKEEQAIGLVQRAMEFAAKAIKPSPSPAAP